MQGNIDTGITNSLCTCSALLTVVEKQVSTLVARVFRLYLIWMLSLTDEPGLGLPPTIPPFYQLGATCKTQCDPSSNRARLKDVVGERATERRSVDRDIRACNAVRTPGIGSS